MLTGTLNYSIGGHICMLDIHSANYNIHGRMHVTIDHKFNDIICFVVVYMQMPINIMFREGTTKQ